jgi:Mn2+/Fe2+ NRAMP family transporter
MDMQEPHDRRQYYILIWPALAVFAGLYIILSAFYNITEFVVFVLLSAAVFGFLYEVAFSALDWMEARDEEPEHENETDWQT